MARISGKRVVIGNGGFVCVFVMFVGVVVYFGGLLLCVVFVFGGVETLD